MSDWRIEPLTPERVADYLAFFDHEEGPAFADNPTWAKCYCHFYEVPPAIDWPSLTALQNRIAMQSRIAVGEMEGYLAYEGASVVGWLNVQPRHRLPHCFERMGVEPPPITCLPSEAAVIVCFVIAPTYRRRGVARSLLSGAIHSLAARGFRLVDAFPFKAGDSQDAADHYHGPLSLYLAHGFSILGENADVTTVRKALA
jgi:ribosomal protein S18 acetylase RimI-like enzyme